jgi:hypothetical protein
VKFATLSGRSIGVALGNGDGPAELGDGGLFVAVGDVAVPWGAELVQPISRTARMTAADPFITA